MYKEEWDIPKEWSKGMAAIIFISAIIAGILFRKSKICTIYILTVMYVLVAFRTASADFGTYKMNYFTLSNASEFKYAGFVLFQKIFQNFGMSFEQFNYIFYILVLLLAVIAIRTLTPNINQVLAYYMIFSYPIDAIQMKSFLSEMLSLIGIAIVIKRTASKERSFKSLIVVFVLLVLSLYIHLSSAFNLLAVIFYLIIKNRKNMGKKLLILASILSLLCYGGFFVVILNVANRFGITRNTEYLGFYTLRSGGMGFLLYCGWIMILIFACRYNGNEIYRSPVQSEIGAYTLTSVLIFPFLMLNVEYNRLVRIYMVLMYVFYSNNRRRKVSRRMLLNYGAYFLSVLFAFGYIVGNLFPTTLGALLSNNAIIK